MNIEVIADGVIRDENQNWVYYIDTERVNELNLKRCGKWMYMTADLEHAEKLVREAVITGAVIEAKRSTAAHMALSRSGTGVCCFYLNGDDAKAHHRAIEFLLGHNLVRRTKAGRLYNVSFKFDEQTRAGEYGDDFHAKICLADFVDLDTGEFLT
ncbi:hypothetical protein [Olsenella sp. An270]|uniref:hypothetical protein n=1 Tax=Olsenella sp. An270 TaxID=1965615 RepID=UPI000B388567|nr:hypothetical protein [Olsenella sp. An270]OUO60199.1 hypothetical protein B5F73_02535 [Olsenella sp. An270]